MLRKKCSAPVCQQQKIPDSYSFAGNCDVTITGEGRQIDLRLAHTAIKQCGFFSVSHLLLHGTSAYNGHPRGQDPRHTFIADRLAMELPLPVFMTKNCRCWDSNTQPSACYANTLAHCATAAIGSVGKAFDLHEGYKGFSS